MSSSTERMLNGSTIGCVEVKKEHLIYEWVIKDVKLLPEKNGESIYSPIFRTVNSGPEWKLRFYPQGQNEDDADTVAVFLHLHSQEAETIKIFVHAEFSISGCSISHEIKRTYKINQGYGCGVSKMIRTSELLKLCASDDLITMRIEMNISWETTDKTKYLEEALNSQEGQLNQAFRPLFKESKLSDVVVIVGTQIFPAHKVVLAARSSVFSAMFENKETRENLENEVKIEDMEPNVVEAMLEFFYTDEVTNLEGLACGLLAAAEKYDVQRLKITCEKTLYEKLNKENAAEILIHADLYRLDKLKKHVMEFMDDHLSDVVKTESYKGIEDPALLKEFIASIGSRKESK